MVSTATVSYKKQPGLLSLTAKALTWSPGGGQGANEVDLGNYRIQSLFSSKEGGAKVMLRVGVLPAAPTAPPVEEFFNFTFIAASSALSDRERFKKEISDLVAANRERISNGDTSIPGDTPSAKGKERAIPLPPAPTTFHLRKKVLMSDPALAALHRDLVQSKMISEAEFWEGREDLILAASADEGQRKGRSSEMVDPRPETSEGGEVTVKITPTLIREIFEEYPSVLRAYGDNVPNPLDEQQFWTRYFQSKLFNRNRTTNRAAVNTIKDDKIFDLYLGEEDDNLEPQNLQVDHIYRLLDLAATEQDQHEVTNQAEYTMRAGGQRASLPLMRRFNEHSERLLNASLGNNTAKRPRMALDPGNAGARNAYYDDIVLDDLNATAKEDRIMLEMQDRTKVATGLESAVEESETDRTEASLVLQRTKREFENWQPNLPEFTVDTAAITDTMRDITINIRRKAERNSRESQSSAAFPEHFLRQLTTLQSSSNEFLRQFWSAILPPKASDAKSTPAARAAKAARMKEYLDKVEEKVQGILKQARKEGIERERVEAALQPVRQAVAKAIQIFVERTK